jgi:hypothetical protein
MQGKFEVGMWIEALKKGKHPYLIAQILKMNKSGDEFEIQFEDGTILSERLSCVNSAHLVFA